ncbi:MAG: nuclear transport factor 2 family protein [Gammaproteobacteria bacterium]|nr:nuclear transport factor 2 family protein [Gammaproteobacteria bacterium]
MRKNFAGLMIAASWLCLTPAFADGSSRAQLLQLEQTWMQAAQHRDVPVLQHILAIDYLDINYRGELRDRSDTLRVPNLRMRHLTQSLSDEKVRVYADTAVVTGRGTLTDGGHMHAAWRFTDVFVKHRGVWRAVSSQETVEQNH